MKIRNGFISNSSSSSFICNRENTTSFYANLMLHHLLRYEKDWNDEFSKNRIRQIREAIKWTEHNSQWDLPLSFPYSINYETYIWKQGGAVNIATCNNNRFSEILDDHLIPWREAEPDEVYPPDDLEFLDLETRKKITLRGESYEN